MFVLWFFIAQFYNIVFKGYAPIVMTNREVIDKIIRELEGLGVPSGAKIYELGSGFAGFLQAAEIKFKGTFLVGYEYSFLPYIISSLQIRLQKSRIKIIKKNFIYEKLNDADIIYCYLSRGLMKALEDKFRSELRPGSIVVSYQFPLPSKEPFKAEGPEDSKLYFYRF